MLTVEEAAVQLGVTPHAVRARIKAGQLKATKKGREWRITENALEKSARKGRKPGRPRK